MHMYTKKLLNEKSIDKMSKPYIIYGITYSGDVIVIGYVDNVIMAKEVEKLVINKINKATICNSICPMNGLSLVSNGETKKELKKKLQTLMKNAYHNINTNKSEIKCDKCKFKNIKIKETENGYKSYCKAATINDLYYDIHTIKYEPINKVSSDLIQDLKR